MMDVELYISEKPVEVKFNSIKDFEGINFIHTKGELEEVAYNPLGSTKKRIGTFSCGTVCLDYSNRTKEQRAFILSVTDSFKPHAFMAVSDFMGNAFFVARCTPHWSCSEGVLKKVFVELESNIFYKTA